ncbi:MAG TPA: hypothetical protein VEF34_07140 [Syntrophobacteraceae bacterium]|nr:hypothetical protein [Syntrophobacteraceae bacterium]
MERRVDEHAGILVGGSLRCSIAEPVVIDRLTTVVGNRRLEAD